MPALPQIGVATSGSQGTVGYRDFADRPLSRVGELAENVPGLIATQHSGEGKANRYFLRSFNLDRGTDLAGYVDGAPINMRSHGHGQGYLDLNFLIPELVERVDNAKGPYAADGGDFSAAGTVRFHTADALPRPIAEVTLGSFGYARALAAGSGAIGDGTLLLALDGATMKAPASTTHPPIACGRASPGFGPRPQRRPRSGRTSPPPPHRAPPWQSVARTGSPRRRSGATLRWARSNPRRRWIPALSPASGDSRPASR